MKSTPALRISTAAFTRIMSRALATVTDIDTLQAINAYILDPTFTPRSKIDRDLYRLFTAEIDKAARRSAAARARHNHTTPTVDRTPAPAKPTTTPLPAKPTMKNGAKAPEALRRGRLNQRAVHRSYVNSLLLGLRP